jgi:hypothetical protein
VLIEGDLLGRVRMNKARIARKTRLLKLRIPYQYIRGGKRCSVPTPKDAILASNRFLGPTMAPTSRRTTGLLLRGRVWHIDKVIYGKRICESTGTRDLTEAEALLARRVIQARGVHLFGEQREHIFREAASKFLAENQHKRSLERYERELGRPYPAGFRSIRVHDLKHTYGHRLRVAGVNFEDRRLLLGHKAQHVTTHYSAPEIGTLIEASEKVCELESRASPASSVVRSRV